jgi:hypothetical protein
MQIGTIFDCSLPRSQNQHAENVCVSVCVRACAREERWFYLSRRSRSQKLEMSQRVAVLLSVCLSVLITWNLFGQICFWSCLFQCCHDKQKWPRCEKSHLIKRVKLCFIDETSNGPTCQVAWQGWRYIQAQVFVKIHTNINEIMLRPFEAETEDNIPGHCSKWT